MIAAEMSINPCVFETAGLGFNVQLTKRARSPEKSQRLFDANSFCRSVKDIASEEYER